MFEEIKGALAEAIQYERGSYFFLEMCRIDEPNEQNFTYVKDVKKLLSVMTGNSYEIEFSQEEKERGISMVDIFDKAEAIGVEIGITYILSRMIDRGKSVQEIADDTGYELEKIQAIANAIKNT